MAKRPVTPKSSKLKVVQGDRSDQTQAQRILDAAREYAALGFIPVPVKYRGKAAAQGWEDLLHADDAAIVKARGEINLGLKLGGASSGLTDIDLDSDEAIELAPLFLPPTPAKYGRKSKPQSHWMYRTDLWQNHNVAFYDLKDPEPSSKTLIEIRIGGGEKAAQTVVPPSIHESGETIGWGNLDDYAPAVVDGEALLYAWRKLAFATLMVRKWPDQGGRHHAASVVGGWLARNDVPSAEVAEIVKIIAEHAPTESGERSEVNDRVLAAKSSAEKFEKGNTKVFGHAEFKKVFGEKVALAASKHFITQEKQAGLIFSEKQLAQQFANDYHEEFRYVQAWGWMHWDGCRWAKDRKGKHLLAASEMCKTLSEACPPQTAKSLGALRTLNGVIGLAKVETAIARSEDDFDTDDMLLNTPGGVVDLKTGKMRPCDPALNITKVTRVTPDFKTKTPIWDAFLIRICEGDEGLVAYLRRFLGYSLTGSIKENTFTFWWGSGGNGKGTTTRAVSRIMGDYCTSMEMTTLLRTKHDAHPTGIASLAGARLVIASEVEEGRSWNEALIKELSSPDRKIKARFIAKDFFEYDVKYKILAVGNNKPAFTNVDAAIRRRLQLVPFLLDLPPEEVDKDLDFKIREEWPGVLAWCIRGCLDWQDQGLNPPAVVTKASEDYLEEQDTFGEFMQECLKKSPGINTKTADVFAAWNGFCKKRNEWVGHQKAFNDRMAKVGHKKRRLELGPVFANIELTDEGIEYRGYINF